MKINTLSLILYRLSRIQSYKWRLCCRSKTARRMQRAVCFKFLFCLLAYRGGKASRKWTWQRWKTGDQLWWNLGNSLSRQFRRWWCQSGLLHVGLWVRSFNS